MTIRFWHDEPRNFGSHNVGPARGSKELGKIDGPGLYCLVAEKAQGKSSELRLLQLLQDSEKLRSWRQITHGEDQAGILLEPAEVRFKRTPSGAVTPTSVDGVEGLPTVTEMDVGIETLITGNNLKGDEARARARLKALLGYAPVQSSDERLGILMGAVRGRKELQGDISEQWQELVEAATKRRRLRVEPFRTASEIREVVATHPKRGTSVLDDHDLLSDCLNAMGNAGEKAAEVLRQRLASMEAKVDAVVEAAAFDLDLSGDQARKALAASELHQDETAANLREAERDLDRVRSGYAARQAAEQRRDRLRETHGERPVVDRTRIAKAVEHMDYSVLAAYQDLPETLRDLLEVEDDQSLAQRVIQAHEGCDQVLAALGRIKQHLEEQAQAFLRHENAVQQWERQRAEIEEAIDGPDDEDLEAAMSALAEAQRQMILADKAAAYKARMAELDEALDLARRIDAVAGAYRAAAKDSWGFLGQIITAELRLPWLQVDGLKLFVGYRAGKLNDSPEVIEQARQAAEQLAETLDSLSPVLAPRFILERIRETTEDVEWRDLDDNEQLSTAELHEACMALFVSRVPEGEIRIIPWWVTAALDEESWYDLADRIAARNFVAIGERPRRKGDPNGLFLEKVRRPQDQEES